MSTKQKRLARLEGLAYERQMAELARLSEDELFERLCAALGRPWPPLDGLPSSWPAERVEAEVRAIAEEHGLDWAEVQRKAQVGR